MLSTFASVPDQFFVVERVGAGAPSDVDSPLKYVQPDPTINALLWLGYTFTGKVAFRAKPEPAVDLLREVHGQLLFDPSQFLEEKKRYKK